MILGLGTDLCKIDRIAAALTRERFFLRVYTSAERKRLKVLCEERRGESAAGLFAAKEAVAKALGTGFKTFGFEDIEILPDESGKPVCNLQRGAKTRLEAIGGRAIHVSISHEDGLALAVAIAED